MTSIDKAVLVAYLKARLEKIRADMNRPIMYEEDSISASAVENELEQILYDLENGKGWDE